MTLNEFLGKAGDLFKGDNSEALRETKAELDKLAAAIKQAESDLATAKQTIGTVSKERDEAKASAETKDKKISELEASQKEFDKAVAEKVRAELASQGIQTKELPSGGSDKASTESQLAEARAQMDKETDPVKRSQLAQKCRELRGHSNLFQTEETK